MRRNPLWIRQPGNPDLLFRDDGSVKLPKLTRLAIRMAADYGGCLTRQPTRERAEAVRDALREMIAERGYDMEIRPGQRTETFAVYLIVPNESNVLAQ